VRFIRRSSFLISCFPAILFLIGGLFVDSSVPQAQSVAPSPSPLVAKTELVVLPVSVTDSDGNFISGLSSESFRVYDNGRLQKVSAFREGDTPVTVGLIVDHSRSMGPNLSEVAEAVSTFAQTSNSQDEMFVVDFNDDVSVELLDGKPFTNDPHELAKAVFAIRARGRTALYDAVAEGLLHVQLGQWDKKALIIVSDGGDNASQQKLSGVLALAQRSQVLIYSVALSDGDGEENPDALRRLSKATGGLAFFPTSLQGVAEISRKIARELREQYTLGFVPEGTGSGDSFRQLTVKVAATGHGKLHVRTRPGYFKPEQQHPAGNPGKSAS
jgi:Ca-activated chloride channel homolog